MNWLNKLEEMASRLLPEEDREHQQRGDVMMIDPLLAMDVGIQYEEREPSERSDDGESSTSVQSVDGVVEDIPADAVVELGDSAPEFDDFVAGSSSSFDDQQASVVEPIELESSILDVSADASQLSEQPTGDTTMEKRTPQEVAPSTPPLQPVMNNLPDEPDEELLVVPVDEESSSSLVPPSSSPDLQRDEIVTQQSDEVKQQGVQDNEAVPSPNTVPEIREAQQQAQQLTNSPPQTVPRRKTSSHPFLMTPEPIMQSVGTPLFETPDTFMSPEPRREDEDIPQSPLPPTNIDVVDENNRDMTEFEVNQPLLDWNFLHIPFNPSMNCLGVVHVRVLAAQRLPCPVGSTVQLAVSLAPWHGKVRGETTVSFGGDEDHDRGVCVRWDALNEGAGCSMVHAWNSDDTPIPIIKLDLLFKPIQMLEFNMCALELSCQPLMTQPGVWKKQWCEASPSLKEKSAEIPLVHVEAAFFPATGDDDAEEEDQFEESGMEDSTTGEQSARFDDGSTAISSYLLRSKNKSHLLKLQSFWMPAQCSVCDKSLIGWKRAFRCEACQIDCCGDCQLQIDLQIPCGSNVAKGAVERSIQHKMTLKNVLTTMAPVDEGYKHKQLEKVEEGRRILTGSVLEKVDNQDLATGKQGIGTFKVHLHRACLFENVLPMETEPTTVFEQSKLTTLKQGDYYVRVSCKGNPITKRTKTIQNSGRPIFDTPELFFDLPHYGMVYRIDVIDAYSNHSVGTTLLTAQSMLQLQRDRDVKERGLDAFIPRGRTTEFLKPVRLNLELRTGFKDGFDSDYFASMESRSSKRSAVKPGSISGWISLDACVVEDIDRLYGPSPIQCPPRPPSNLDMELLQLHIGRIGMIIADIKKAFGLYVYVVSWSNPMLTLASLIVFLRLCFTFDVEYIGSLPMFFLIATMIYLALSRHTGHLKDRFVQRERDSCAKLEMDCMVDRSVHRPLGAIQVYVRKGRNLKSRELGLPGSVGCHVIWHPLRFSQNEKEISELSSSDKALKAHHDVGDTNYLFTTNPDWKAMKESEDLMRLKQLVPAQNDTKKRILDTSDPGGLAFPLLHPIQRCSSKKSDMDEDKESDSVALAQWEDALGAIVVQVRFVDVINMLPGFENILGEVVIPVSKLIEKGEYEGWFQVVEVGATHYVRCAEDSASETPRIFLQLKWCPPVNATEISDTEREESIVVGEEMVRAAIRNSKSRLGIIGSSVGALNTVRGIGGSVQTIQNTLGSVVDLLETVRNLFNFTDPQLSSLLFVALFVLWVFVAIVPTRAIVCVGGTAQYAVTLLARLKDLQSQQKDNEKPVASTEKQQTAPPMLGWVLNAISSIPNDEDLRKAYFWESARISERESSRRAAKKRISRLQQLWNAKWFSVVKVKIVNTGRGVTSARAWRWEDRFVVVHGRRLLIWESDKSFDEGDPPLDRVFLAGHAGLAGLSPIEMRELSSDEIPRVANIFGRGSSEQLKLMMLIPDQYMKEALEDVVLSAAVKDD
jgi:hypothetical protein